jgi:hypothetical protein
MPARLPVSTSAFFTHSFSVCALQPILAAIDVIAAQRDGGLSRSGSHDNLSLETSFMW